MKCFAMNAKVTYLTLLVCMIIALYIGDVSPSLWSGGTSAANEERKAVVGSLKDEFQQRGAPPRTVSAQCTETEVIVTINPDLLGIGKPVQASDLTIGGCGVTRQVATPAAFVIDAPLHGCGSTVKTLPDNIVYEFTLEYKPTAIPGLPIMRTNAAVIKIECHYARHHNVSSHALNPTWIPYTSTQDFLELLDFSLLVMNSDWSGPRPSYTFYFGDLINLQASMHNSSHVPLRLFVDSCVGTDASAQSYTFIGNNGCIIDDKVSGSGSQFVIPRISPSVLRFKLDVFKFYGTGNNSIFITCQLKATFASQNVDALNKACSFNPGLNQWQSVDGNDQVCSCCDTSCATSFPGRKSSHVSSSNLNSAKIPHEWVKAVVGPFFLKGGDVVNGTVSEETKIRSGTETLT
uniref:Zona pellucida sperm-binding protein 3 n=1 Tax=Erpetoichthys calabaricus TaxID=27687 RepID=A0A8C4X6T1_ERPCA